MLRLLDGALKHFRPTEEVAQKWSLEDQLIEESYGHPFKHRRVNSAHNILQVLAIAFEVKLSETPRRGKTRRLNRVGCPSRCSRSARDRGDRKPMKSSRSLVNVDRVVTTSSDEIIPEFGISKRRKVTRSVADKRSFPNARNRNVIPLKSNNRSRGAWPPRNESGIIGAFSLFEPRVRSVNCGNRFLIATDFNSEFGTLQILSLYTRSWRFSMILPTPDCCDLVMRASITIGNASQTSSSLFTGFLFVQRSSRRGQRGEESTTSRHSRHTCTNACHSSSWSV